jgi:hypothetical protein
MGGGRLGRGLRGEPFQPFRLAPPDLDDEPEDFEEEEPDRPDEDDPPDRTEPPEDEPPERGAPMERPDEDPVERGALKERPEEDEPEDRGAAEDRLEGPLDRDGDEPKPDGREIEDFAPRDSLSRADGRELEELEEGLRL